MNDMPIFQGRLSAAFLLMTVLVLIVAGPSFSQPLYSIYEIQQVPVGQDSSLMCGDTVRVRGVVTAGAGLFYAGTHITFYMGDPAGGPWNGVLVYNADNSAFATLIGDSVEVTAVVGEYSTFSGRASAMTELVTISEVEILAELIDLPDVITLTCGVLDSNNYADSLAEPYEGCLVQVRNVIVTDNSSPYRQFNVGDATGECVIRTYSDSLINFVRPPVGTPFESITGEVYQVYGNYTIMPRTAADLVLATGPPLISGTHIIPQAPTSSDTITVLTSIMDDGSVDEASLFYRLNGSNFNEVVLLQIGEISYRAYIPPQPDQTLIGYYVWAMDDEGNEATDPPDAPDSVYSVRVSNATASTIYDIQYTTNPNGESPYVGTVATVQAVVTADTVDFPLTAGRRYYIQDTDDPYGTGGAWNGIYVYNTTSDPVVVHAHRGDRLSITGTVTEYYGFTELGPITAYNIISSGNPLPTPVQVTCAQIRTGSSTAESFESVLVELSNLTVTNNDLGYGEWMVRDGSGDSSRIDDDGNYAYVPQIGDHIDHIIGVLKYANEDFKLEPRDDNDLIGTAVHENPNPMTPLKWSLATNYPNPFNPVTVIPFEIPELAKVKIVVYNVLGQQVCKLIDRNMEPGLHSVTWDGRSDQGVPVGSGIYFIHLSSGKTQLSQKMVLMK
jgi:hypothetical protein